MRLSHNYYLCLGLLFLALSIQFIEKLLYNIGASKKVPMHSITKAQARVIGTLMLIGNQSNFV